MSAVTLTARFDAAFSDELSGIGFMHQGPRRWLRTSKAPVVELVELAALKGASYVVRGGFGIQFCPKCSNGTLIWKRTDKTADMDLVFDPLDITLNGRDYLYDGGPDKPGIPCNAVDIVSRGVKLALTFFNQVSGLRDLPAMFDMRAGMKSNRFAVDNYIQFKLGRGLSLIAAGQATSGQVDVDAFCDSFEISRGDPKIVRAIEDANAYARAAK